MHCWWKGSQGSAVLGKTSKIIKCHLILATKPHPKAPCTCSVNTPGDDLRWKAVQECVGLEIISSILKYATWICDAWGTADRSQISSLPTSIPENISVDANLVCNHTQPQCTTEVIRAGSSAASLREGVYNFTIYQRLWNFLLSHLPLKFPLAVTVVNISKQTLRFHFNYSLLLPSVFQGMSVFSSEWFILWFQISF